MQGFNVAIIWLSMLQSQGNTPPPETFFILLQDGGKITTQTGDNFELQEAP